MEWERGQLEACLPPAPRLGLCMQVHQSSASGQIGGLTTWHSSCPRAPHSIFQARSQLFLAKPSTNWYAITANVWIVWLWQELSEGKQPGLAGGGCFLTNVSCWYEDPFASEVLPHFMAGCKFCIDFLNSFFWRLNSEFHVSLERRWNHPAVLLVKIMGNLTCHLAISWSWLSGSLVCFCLEDNTGPVIAHADQDSRPLAWDQLSLQMLIQPKLTAKVSSSSQALSGGRGPFP